MSASTAAPTIRLFLLDDHLASRRPLAEALPLQELDVLDWLARGATSKEIARALGLRSKTIDNHRARILDKLGVCNSVAAVRIAVTTRLVNAGAGAIA